MAFSVPLFATCETHQILKREILYACVNQESPYLYTEQALTIQQMGPFCPHDVNENRSKQIFLNPK